MSGAAWAQADATRSHPEIVAALTCAQISPDAFARGTITNHPWTKQDWQQILAKFNDCQGNAGRPSGETETYASAIDARIRTAPDPEGVAKKNADAQRVIEQRRQEYAAAQEKARADAQAGAAEQARRAVEQDQITQTRLAEQRAAEAQNATLALQAQQAAADQAVRDRKQQAAAQAAADQASADRIARAKRQQLAAEQAAEEAAAKLPKPLTVDCEDPSTLANVAAIMGKRPGTQVFKVYNGEQNPHLTAYLAAPALDRVKLSQYIFSVPQCYATAMTSTGEQAIAFRTFIADKDTYVEVTMRD